MLHHHQSYRSLNSWLLPLCNNSSSTRCDAVSVSSQLDTHIAEVLAGVTLSINAFEFLHVGCPSGTSFLPVGCFIMDDEEMYVQVSYYERLSKTQTVLEERSCPR